MALMFTKKFVVPLSEVTPGYALKPFHMLNMFQDAADGAVEALNPPADYWTNGCGWMLLQYTIRLSKPLMAGDSVTINTGHRPLRDLYSCRRFRFLERPGLPRCRTRGRRRLDRLRHRRRQRCPGCNRRAR